MALEKVIFTPSSTGSFPSVLRVFSPPQPKNTLTSVFFPTTSLARHTSSHLPLHARPLTRQPPPGSFPHCRCIYQHCSPEGIAIGLGPASSTLFPCSMRSYCPALTFGNSRPPLCCFRSHPTLLLDCKAAGLGLCYHFAVCFARSQFTLAGVRSAELCRAFFP